MTSYAKTFEHPVTGDQYTIEPLTPIRLLSITKTLQREGYTVKLGDTEMQTSLAFSLAVCRTVLVDLKRRNGEGFKDTTAREREEAFGVSTALMKWISQKAQEVAAEIDKQYEADSGN